MLTCKQDVLMSSGMSTHPSAYSVVDGLPGGECSGLHHENQQVDHRPAEPVDRHETCTATCPFVTAIVRLYIENFHGLHDLEATSHEHNPLSCLCTVLQSFKVGTKAAGAANMVDMQANDAALSIEH
jgi:hypothetical protein